MLTSKRNSLSFLVVLALGVMICCKVGAQIDPMRRNLIQLGYDQPLTGKGPQAVYGYYYYSNPDFFNTNTALRAALAPAYVDSEIGFKHLLSPNTDLGLGLYGGAYGDNYYEVRQGDYLKGESFDGHGGGAAVSVYHLLNPGMLIPLNVVARGGLRYSTYSDSGETFDNFATPDDQVTAFTRVGLRFAGKEPILYPDLGLEVSVWYERQWRFSGNDYGFASDRHVNADASLYWIYAGLNYSFTNTGQKVSFAFTGGGAANADRFSAWRMGGVLPLVSEFPLTLPGYYYQELTATRFAHFYGAYDIPLDTKNRWKFRLEAATAHLDYLSGFEQPSDWQTGAGGGITFTPVKKNFQVVVRYGYGFNALRHGDEGGQSVGILFQYDFEAPKKAD